MIKPDVPLTSLCAVLYVASITFYIFSFFSITFLYVSDSRDTLILRRFSGVVKRIFHVSRPMQDSKYLVQVSMKAGSWEYDETQNSLEGKTNVIRKTIS